MTDLQKDFLKELAGCGVSETALIAVAILVENPKDIAEMADRIADLMEKEGRDPTDGEVLEIMVQMMKGAATPSNPTVTTWPLSKTTIWIPPGGSQEAGGEAEIERAGGL